MLLCIECLVSFVVLLLCCLLCAPCGVFADKVSDNTLTLASFSVLRVGRNDDVDLPTGKNESSLINFVHEIAHKVSGPHRGRWNRDFWIFGFLDVWICLLA